MKPVYYYNCEEKILSSHVNLIRLNGRNARNATFIPTKFGYPGIRTPVTNTLLLTPNSKLDLNTMAPVRFWPEKRAGQLRLADAIPQAHSYLKGAFEHYNNFYHPVISVTAGLDSRLTLSFTKGINKLTLFTYYRNDNEDTDRLDRTFAEAFSSISDNEVNIIELEKMNEVPLEFSEIQQENTTYDHIKRLAWVYYELYRSKKDVLHIRSNISETGRNFWKSKKFPVISGKDLARIYLYGDKEYQAKYVFDVIDRFEEFDTITGLTGCRHLVDVKSLFYWEFRMASWHSAVVAESDPAFDTVSVYNSRKILETMLSVDAQIRSQGLILRNIIFREWPELANHDINGKPFWPGSIQPVRHQPKASFWKKLFFRT